MSTITEIRAALKTHGPMTCTELAVYCNACENDRQIVARTIAGLRAEGKVKGAGLDAGEPIYAIDDWPADGEEALRRPDAPKVETFTNTLAEPKLEISAAPPTPRREEEPAMSTATHIIAALTKHGPMTVSELRKYVKGNVPTICSQLLKSAKIGKLGGGKRSTIYGLPDQKAPAPKSEPDAPPRHLHARKKKSRIAKFPKALPPTVPARAAANGDANGHARFAIDADGTLGILKDGVRVDLELDEFEQLRGFIERTKQVWQPA